MEISAPRVISICWRSPVHELSSQRCINRVCLIILSALHFIKSSGAVGDIPGIFGGSLFEGTAGAKFHHCYGGAGPGHEILIIATTISEAARKGAD